MTKADLIKELESRIENEKKLLKNCNACLYYLGAGIKRGYEEVIDLIRDLDEPADKEPCGVVTAKYSPGDYECGNCGAFVCEKDEYDESIKYCRFCGRRLGGARYE
jgi:hypothetical protein